VFNQPVLVITRVKGQPYSEDENRMHIVECVNPVKRPYEET